MILWLTGNVNAGKTTLAKKFTGWINLDGDELREIWGYDLSENGRIESNIKAAKLAKLFDSQGFNVAVSTICPYNYLRKMIKDICKCEFIYIPGGDTENAFPDFEIPTRID